MDDTEQVLEHLQGENFSVTEDGDEVQIRIYTARIKVFRGKFTRPTIERLFTVCQETEFHYIISDYAYIFSPPGNERLREALSSLLPEQRQEAWIDNDLGENAYRTLADLPQTLDEWAASDRNQDRAIASLLRKKIVGHTGELILYSNSPEPFDSRFEGAAAHKLRRTFYDTFKNAKRRRNLVVKMHQDFIIRPDAQEDWDGPELDDFKKAIVSANLQSFLREEALRKIVAERRGMRFIRHRKVMQRIVKHSIFIGIAGALWSTIVFETVKYGYLQNSDVSEILICLIMLMILFFFFMVWSSSKIEDEFGAYIEDND